MRLVRFFSKFFISLLLTVACSQDKSAKLPPSSASKELLQIFFILGEDKHCLFPFASRLPVEELEARLGARITVHRQKEAKPDLLREVNARNPSLIVLSEGWPQEQWAKLNLPAYPGRRVLKLGEQVQIPWNLLNDFSKEACRTLYPGQACKALPVSCRQKIGMKESADKAVGILSFDAAENAEFQVSMLWPQLLEDVRRLSVLPDVISVDVRSAYLQLRPTGVALGDDSSPKSKFLRQWLFKRL
jgi:hypothetical protein